MVLTFNLNDTTRTMKTFFNSRFWMKQFAVPAVLLPWFAFSTQADWTRFRGPHANGTADGLEIPRSLSTAENVHWKHELPGRGLSSPIIVGSKVFVTASSGPRQERLHVLAFDAATGRKLWERTFQATGRTMCHEKTSVAAPTPTSDGSQIYAIFSSNDVVCLDLEGNLVWYRGLGHDYPNASNSLGMSSSLLVARGVLITQVENDSESFTAGLDVRHGTTLWKLDRPKMANWTSPTLLQPTKGEALVGLQSGKGLTIIDPTTGQTVWDYTDGASTTASSAISGQRIYAPSRGLTALEPAEPGAPLKQVWRSSQLRPGTPSPVVVEDKILILVDGGVLTCASTENGTRLWQIRLKGPFSSTPVASGKLLLAVNEKGLVQVVDLSGAEGSIIAELDLNQTVLSTPSLSNQSIFIRSENMLWKLGNPQSPSAKVTPKPAA